jgi:hypothetical protein
MNNNEELFNCLVCHSTQGYIKRYLNCKCLYFVCTDCKKTWTSRNNGIFKCFYGCKSNIQTIRTINTSDQYVHPIICYIDYILEKIYEFILNKFNNTLGTVIYLLSSIVITIFVIVPVHFIGTNIKSFLKFVLEVAILYPIYCILVSTKLSLFFVAFTSSGLIKIIYIIYTLNKYYMYIITCCTVIYFLFCIIYE